MLTKKSVYGTPVVIDSCILSSLVNFAESSVVTFFVLKQRGSRDHIQVEPTMKSSIIT